MDTPHTLQSAPSCTDDRDPASLSVEEARSRIMADLQPVGPALKRPLRGALGQVLAEDVVSPINVPNHVNSAMDGYALGGNDLPDDAIREYRVIGTAYAGVPFTATCNKGECVRIMTGAPMPAGTDTVVMQEQTEIAGKTRFASVQATVAGKTCGKPGRTLPKTA